MRVLWRERCLLELFSSPRWRWLPQVRAAEQERLLRWALDPGRDRAGEEGMQGGSRPGLSGLSGGSRR